MAASPEDARLEHSLSALWALSSWNCAASLTDAQLQLIDAWKAALEVCCGFLQQKSGVCATLNVAKVGPAPCLSRMSLSVRYGLLLFSAVGYLRAHDWPVMQVHCVCMRDPDAGSWLHIPTALPGELLSRLVGGVVADTLQLPACLPACLR